MGVIVGPASNPFILVNFPQPNIYYYVLYLPVVRWNLRGVAISIAEATKRGKQKWHVGDLLADERCSPAVLDFLRSTHVGRTAPPVEENWDSEEEAEVEEMGDGEEQAE